MPLRDYQDCAVFSLFDYFERARGNPVVAMPTGTGKSWVIGDFVRQAIQRYDRTRVMVLTHVKELIEQNAEKLQTVWPTAPLGIYSAGLKQRDTMLPIIFGGVKSVYHHLDLFGSRDLIIIDEAHLLSPENETMYQKVLGHFKALNPYLKVIGLTATPYRMGQGMITEDGIFTDICFDLTDYENFNRLIACGWLAPLIGKKTDCEIDTAGVGTSGYDFKPGELEVAADKITVQACQYAVGSGADRKSWMAFASGIKHAEHIAEVLRKFGISAAAVHSDLDKIDKNENKRRIDDFKAGKLRCLVNMNKLTTGFDHPAIDYIMMLRPTKSTGLWVQMAGRGTRTSPGKINCKLDDFTSNTRTLGPINDPKIPRKPGEGGGDVPIKICPVCNAYNHAAARICDNCGHEFTFQTKIRSSAADLPVMRSDQNVVEYFNVKRVQYSKHQKNLKDGDKGKPTLKVVYYCGMQRFTKWVCLEHSGLAGKMARDWWRQHHWTEPPTSVDEALRYVSEFRTPARVRVWLNKEYPDVLSYEY